MAASKESQSKALSEKKDSLDLTKGYVSIFLDKNGQLTEESHKEGLKIVHEEKNSKEKIEALEKLVDQNNPAAMYDLATCYRNQFLGIKHNETGIHLKKAFDLVYKAAMLQFPPALYSLAEYCRTKKDLPLKNGKDELGTIYVNTEPTEENYLKWLQAAASQGFAMAECYLALWYKDHPGRDADLHMALARSLLESAARKGLQLAKKILDKMVPDTGSSLSPAIPASLKANEKPLLQKPVSASAPEAVPPAAPAPASAPRIYTPEQLMIMSLPSVSFRPAPAKRTAPAERAAARDSEPYKPFQMYTPEEGRYLASLPSISFAPYKPNTADLSLDREKSVQKPAQDPLVPELQKHLQDKEKQLELLKDQEALLDQKTVQMEKLLQALNALKVTARTGSVEHCKMPEELKEMIEAFSSEKELTPSFDATKKNQEGILKQSARIKAEEERKARNEKRLLELRREHDSLVGKKPVKSEIKPKLRNFF